MSAAREFTGYMAGAHARLASRLSEADRMCRGHAQLMAMAGDLHMESEYHRQRELLEEWQAEAEAVRDEAVGLGFVPEDFER